MAAVGDSEVADQLVAAAVQEFGHLDVLVTNAGTNAYLLALAATLILGGKLGDRFGRRTYYVIGVAGFTVASVAIGLAGSIEGVIAFRAVQGVFGAIMMPNFVMLYLQNVRGYTPVEAGVRTLPLSLASVVASPLGAKITEQFGPRVSMPLGMACQALASVAMLGWDIDSSYTALWPPFVGLGLGVGMVMAASSDAIMGNAPVRDGGVAGGLQATSPQIGGALGTSVLVSVISGRVSSTLYGELTSARVPTATAHSLEKAEDAVAMGISPASTDMPLQLRAAVTEGAGNAFMNGVHTAVTVTAALCVLGLLLSVVGLPTRSQDSRH